MTPAAPRIDARLVAAAELADRPTLPIAETCRRVGRIAGRLGLVRPSYEQVRTIVHDLRRRGRRPSTGDILLDIALRTRPPEALGEHLAGVSRPP